MSSFILKGNVFVGNKINACEVDKKQLITLIMQIEALAGGTSGERQKAFEGNPDYDWMLWNNNTRNSENVKLHKLYFIMNKLITCSKQFNWTFKGDNDFCGNELFLCTYLL